MGEDRAAERGQAGLYHGREHEAGGQPRRSEEAA
jgi:hypothetical protein